MLLLWIVCCVSSLAMAMDNQKVDEEDKDSITVMRYPLKWDENTLSNIQEGTLWLGMTPEEWEERCLGSKELGYPLFQKDHKSVSWNLDPSENVPFSHIQGDFNDVSVWERLVGLTKGKFDHIIMDRWTWYCTRWTSDHLKYIHAMLSDGGEFLYQPEIQGIGMIPVKFNPMDSTYTLGSYYLKMGAKIYETDQIGNEVLKIMQDTLKQSQELNHNVPNALLTGGCERFMSFDDRCDEVIKKAYERLVEKTIIPQHKALWETAGFEVACEKEPFPIPIPEWTEDGGSKILTYPENKKQWLIRAKKKGKDFGW